MGISTEEQLIKMVVTNRTDIIIGTNPNISYDINKYGYADDLKQTVYTPEQQTPLYFGISLSSRLMEYQKEIDLFLKEMVNSSEMEVIKNKYLGDSYR